MNDVTVRLLEIRKAKGGLCGELHSSINRAVAGPLVCGPYDRTVTAFGVDNNVFASDKFSTGKFAPFDVVHSDRAVKVDKLLPH